MSRYGGPGFPYAQYSEALYQACLEVRREGLLTRGMEPNLHDPKIIAIIEKHLEPFKQWKQN